MKTYLIFGASLFLLFSCSVKESTPGHVETGHTQAESSAHAGGLALNANERWQADEATNTHMRQLQELMRQHQTLAEPNSVEALHTLGLKMRQELKELFADCRMQGPEHEMLHTYLLPMLEDVKTLETKAAPGAAVARNRLAQRLGQYQTYFK